MGGKDFCKDFSPARRPPRISPPVTPKDFPQEAQVCVWRRRGARNFSLPEILAPPGGGPREGPMGAPLWPFCVVNYRGPLGTSQLEIMKNLSLILEVGVPGAPDLRARGVSATPRLGCSAPPPPGVPGLGLSGRPGSRSGATRASEAPRVILEPRGGHGSGPPGGLGARDPGLGGLAGHCG